MLSDPAAAAHLPIGALGNLADTSSATVMRFCRAIGLAKYPQLRLALASAAAREDVLGGDRPAVTTDISATDTLDRIVEKIIYNEVRALEETGTGVDIDTLSRAIDAVSHARRVDIFGVGASGFVAQDLHQKLHRIGLMAFIWTDTHAALTAAALLRPEDVAVAISHSGTTQDTIEPLQVAAERGATTIALTNFARSPSRKAPTWCSRPASGRPRSAPAPPSAGSPNSPSSTASSSESPNAPTTSRQRPSRRPSA